MRFVLCACALLMACTAPAREEAIPVASNTGVPAPTPNDVVTRIGADQNGQTVNVAVGQRFAVELVGVPTAGYVWAAKTVPAFLSASGETSGNTSSAQSQPGFVGGNHWEVLMFTANGAGSGELVLEQRRPWETNEPANSAFRVTVVAR